MRIAATLLFVLAISTASVTAIPKLVSEAAMVENSWETKAPMHQARGGLGVVAVNNKIYAIGGAILSGVYPPDILGGFVGTNEEYNTATDTWTSKSSMPTPRDHFAIAAYENKIYCIGGAVGVRVDERTHFRSYVESGINEVYDIASDQWQTLAPMPKSSMRIQASVIDGKIWVTGVGLTYLYDPLTNSWTNKTAMPFSPPPSTASLPVQTSIGTKIFVTGEFSTDTITSEQKILIYDTWTDTWSQGTHAPAIVANGGVGATSGRTSLIRIYVLGLVKYPPEPANQVYDPKTKTWNTATPMPTLRMDFGVAAVDDILYAIGGYFVSEPLLSRVVPTNVNEQYTPFGYGAPDPSYVPPFASLVYLPYITINSDGTVEPQTGTIEKAGSVYSLTSNLTGSYAIKIKCSNIIFDGKGHAINGSSSYSWAAQNDGLSLEDAANVTVKNLEISRFNPYDVSIKNCQSCTIQNVKANTLNMENSHQNTISESALAGNDINVQAAIIMSGSSSNKIQRSNVTGIILKDSDSNTFLENNIVFQHTHIFSGSAGNLWDNGTIGNWWSDYNGTDADGDGVGDTPYIIDANNTDRYPLMKPVVIPELPGGSGEAEPFPTVAVLAVGIFAAVLVGAGLLLYHRKRQGEAGQP